MKICNTCKVEKDDSEFSTKPGRNGTRRLAHECKTCSSIKAKSKYANESEEDRSRRVSKAKAWKASNRDVVIGLKRKYRLIKKVDKLSSIPHDHHVKAYIKYNERQLKVKHDQHVKEWRKSLGNAGQMRWKYKNDPKHMLYTRLKRGIQRGFKDRTLKEGWFDRLGYTMDELVIHIEKQFTDGMGWHNFSEWHIDHIIPIKSFNLNSVMDETFAACYSMHNLRPIWARDNMIKYRMVDKYLINKTKSYPVGVC